MLRAPSTKDEYRRQELAGLLRTRRARISPAEVGLNVAPGSRRRTPGLRREDVAQLAGISSSLYTWLEQGRDIKTSRRVVDSISRVLKFDPTERRLFNELALHGGSEEAESFVHSGREPWMEQLLDSLVEVPAFIMDSRWDILHWNVAACAVVTDFSALSEKECNALWLMFMGPQFRRDLVDWETSAKAALARFRIDYGMHAGQKRFVELVDELLEASPEFRTWWSLHDLDAPIVRQTRRFNPEFGELVLDHVYLQFRHARDLTLTMFHADEENRARIRAAIRSYRERSQATPRHA